jgi:hypothetical protein
VNEAKSADPPSEAGPAETLRGAPAPPGDVAASWALTADCGDFTVTDPLSALARAVLGVAGLGELTCDGAGDFVGNGVLTET